MTDAIRRTLTTAASLLIATSVLAGVDMTSSDQQKITQIEQQTQVLQQEISTLRQEQADHAMPASDTIKASDKPSTTPTVTTTPYLEMRSAFDGSDVLQEYATINEDLTLLQDNQTAINQSQSPDEELQSPIISLSGGIEGQFYHKTDNFGGVDTKNQGINLTTSELDVLARASQWATAFMSINYNGGPTDDNNRNPDRGLSLTRGFVTIGDLNKSSFYATVGDFFPPFGRFSTMMLTPPETYSMASINTQAALLGYYHNGLNISTFGYSGSMTSGSNNVIKQGGANVRYDFSKGDNNYEVAASYVSNIADAEGFQSTSAADDAFAGFGVSDGSNNNGNDLAHRVDGLDFNAKAEVGNFALIGEYVTATRAFDVNDLNYNGSAATPSSVHAEIQYMTETHGKPLGFALAYGHTWESLALNLPQDSITTVISTSWWKNTVESIEYRCDFDYDDSNSYTTSSSDGNTKSTGTGKVNHSIIAQLGVYF